jgi:hypothetical protein
MRKLRVLGLAFVVITVAARTEPGPPNAPTVDQLKLAYLDCDRRASVGLLGFGDAAACSRVHEELKQRGFGGDWGRMLAWWKSQSAASEIARQRAESAAR